MSKPKKRKRNSDTEDEKLVEAGKSALRRQYYGFIRDTAQEILKDAEAKHDDYDDAQEDINERIGEEADGSYWVIYTHANLETLMASDNWLAIDEDGLENFLGSEPSLTNVLSSSALVAVQADLRQSIDAYVSTGDYFADKEDNPGRKRNRGKRSNPTKAKLLR